jgi:hypothetical protein
MRGFFRGFWRFLVLIVLTSMSAGVAMQSLSGKPGNLTNDFLQLFGILVAAT